VIGTNRYPDVDRWHRAALWAAMRSLCDEALLDISRCEEFRGKQSMGPFDSYLVGFIPERRPYRYTPDFVREFAICMLIVIWKLAEPTNVFPVASVAEQLALGIVIDEAERTLRDARDSDVVIPDVPLDLIINFLPFSRAVFGDDTEFRLLYLRGPCELRHFEKLRFGEWFKPHSNGAYVHPYGTAGWPPQRPAHLGWFSAFPTVDAEEVGEYAFAPRHGQTSGRAMARSAMRHARLQQGWPNE